ncbi:phosphoribosyltransferase [Aeromonas veronii]|uniref:phosphoribosyltransferase n=1 Tax=Aeromonas veronii TaxID=654 RepID=UPI001BCF4DA0|nr:phosphoribosyltransferase [Aeromonas veronii]MBS4726279.1 phosphoribosyltransferase [Aeromonas veronii]
MFITLQPFDYVNVRSCGVYYPYAVQRRNGRRDPLSCMMMDFKNSNCPGHRASISHFTALLNERLERLHYADRRGRLVDQEVQVAIVPSHNAGRVSAALTEVVRGIAQLHRNLSAPVLLERITDVPSAHEENGDRSIPHHMQTIRVIAANLRPNIPIILLDDVTTTGGSMSACYHLLKQAGATEIYPIALLETANS